MITPLLTALVTSLASKVGGVFETLQSGAGIYQDALKNVPDLSASPLAMSFGFVKALDPFSDGSALQIVMSALIELVQKIVGSFLYGCDVFDDEGCGDLPSVRNDVLPIRERRDGTIYMASGCDSEFEGELAFYQPALDIVEKLLENASDVSCLYVSISQGNMLTFMLKKSGV